MMIDRIRLGVELLNQEGDFLCHIDENEYERLHLIFERFLPDAGTIAWDKRNPMNAGRGIANQHEYIIWRSKQEKPIYLQNNNALSMLEAAKTIVKKYKGVTDKAKKEFAEWIDDNEKLSGGEKAYRYLDEQGQIYQSVSLRAPEPRANRKFHQPLVHPITKKPCSVPPNGFSRTPETLMDMVKNGEILFGVDETTQPRQKVLLTAETRKQLSSVIQDAKKGKADLDPLGLDFPYCHPVSLYQELLGASLKSSDDIVLDFFAGSGTSAHAVMNLNLDERKRKYILVEVGDHFDAVIKPRLKKIIYSQDWQDGRPTSQNGSSHAFKYMTLESYEDALDSIVFQSPDKQDMFKLDDYVLSYMLDFETRQSETLLNVAKLDTPFDYKLKRHGKDKALPIDLPETFNYLIGLQVDSRCVYENKGTRYLVYRGKAGGKQTVVIWRTTSGWDKKEFEQDRDFVLKEKLNEGAEDVFLNTDSFIPGARSLDPVFKHRMFNEE
jgi:adenine-specific DNA-methyltransferase